MIAFRNVSLSALIKMGERRSPHNYVGKGEGREVQRWEMIKEVSGSVSE